MSTDFTNTCHGVAFVKFINDDIQEYFFWGFPGGAVVENLPANAGDTGSGPGLGRFPHSVEQLGP